MLSIPITIPNGSHGNHLHGILIKNLLISCKNIAKNMVLYNRKSWNFILPTKKNKRIVGNKRESETFCWKLIIVYIVLLSYCGLLDLRISASEKDLPVKTCFLVYLIGFQLWYSRGYQAFWDKKSSVTNKLKGRST